MSDPTATTTTTVSPTSTTTTVAHGGLLGKIETVGQTINADLHGALDWTVHTAEQLGTFLQGKDGQALLAALPPALTTAFEALLPAALPAGTVSVLAAIQASPIAAGALAAIDNYLGVTDAAFVLSVLARISTADLLAAATAIESAAIAATHPATATTTTTAAASQ